MTPETRTLLLDRLARIRETLDRLTDIVSTDGTSTSPPASPPPSPAPPAATVAARSSASPPAAAGTIDPAQAAEILGVARQTVDRRLKGGATTGPGAPVDISGGTVRSRWRWASEADVRAWWAAAR